MKLHHVTFLSPTRRRRMVGGGFTLAEIMIVMAIFSLLILALVSSQLFGLRMYRISETKLTATDSGRKVLNRIRDEIRSGKRLEVGNGSGTSFTPVTGNAKQIGNALQIYPSTDTNNFVRYYLNPGDTALERITSSDTTPVVLANYITNQMLFQAENFQGNVLTNSQNNRVIRMVLEFYQWEYPIATSGQGGLYDYYRLQTRITKRLIE